jgi:hypothetical protein
MTTDLATFAGLALIAAGLYLLAVLGAVWVDRERDADARRDAHAARVAAARAWVDPPTDPRQYVARGSRWPARITPSDIGGAWHPWRVALGPGMDWACNGHRHARLAEPAPEIIRRLRLERALTEPTAGFTSIVLASLFDLAAAAIRPEVHA